MSSVRLRRVVLLLVAALGLVALGTSAAGAQDGDPYGSTTTTTAPPDVAPTCRLSVSAAGPGAKVTATVSDVPLGERVRSLFAGREVGSATAADTAAAGAGAPVLFGGVARPVAARRATTTVVIEFTVPQVAPGTYLITAVGADFTCECDPASGGNFEVLGETVTNGGSSGAVALPFTGIEVALFLAVALVLLLVGRSLVAASRRRHRRLERRAAADGRRHAASSAGSGDAE